MKKPNNFLHAVLFSALNTHFERIYTHKYNKHYCCFCLMNCWQNTKIEKYPKKHIKQFKYQTNEQIHCLQRDLLVCGAATKCPKQCRNRLINVFEVHIWAIIHLMVQWNIGQKLDGVINQINIYNFFFILKLINRSTVTILMTLTRLTGRLYMKIEMCWKTICDWSWSKCEFVYTENLTRNRIEQSKLFWLFFFTFFCFAPSVFFLYTNGSAISLSADCYLWYDKKNTHTHTKSSQWYLSKTCLKTAQTHWLK